jgi:hypothetical protein
MRFDFNFYLFIMCASFVLTACDSDSARTKSDELIAPIADAGADFSVDEDMNASLFGKGTDEDGEIVSYRWTQVGGIDVSLVNADSNAASFKSPIVTADTELTFELLQ